MGNVVSFRATFLLGPSSSAESRYIVGLEAGSNVRLRMEDSMQANFSRAMRLGTAFSGLHVEHFMGVKTTRPMNQGRTSASRFMWIAVPARASVDLDIWVPPEMWVGMG